MARVTAWEKGHQDVRAHETEVTCYVQTLTDSSGQQIIHLSTFGSRDRISAPKSSQVLQLDLANARRLVIELVDAFGPTVLP